MPIITPAYPAMCSTHNVKINPTHYDSGMQTRRSDSGQDRGWDWRLERAFLEARFLLQVPILPSGHRVDGKRRAAVEVVRCAISVSSLAFLMTFKGGYRGIPYTPARYEA